jgi:hypothetical protein
MKAFRWVDAGESARYTVHFLFLIDRLHYPLAAVLHSPPTVDRALWGVATAVGKSFRVVLNVPEG